METREPQLLLNELRPDQWEIAIHPAKIKTISCGRRYGKSTLCGNVALNMAVLYGYEIAWVVPVYNNSRPLWRFCERACAELIQAGKAHRDKAAHIFSFAGGGSISIFSADRPESILGNNFDMVIIDEAARVNQDVYDETILPMVADTDGSIWMISTPRGLNWFYTEYRRGLDEMDRDGENARQASFHRSTLSNPSPNIQKAYYLAETRIPSRKFRQEWKAEFTSDGALFTNVEQCVYGNLPPAPPKPERRQTFVAGVDLGKVGDPTVVTIMDAETMKVVWLQRWQVDYTEQVRRLKKLSTEIKLDAIIVEQTGNLAVIEMMHSADIGITPFNTTNESKGMIIDNLIAAFEMGQISIPNDERLVAELLMFEQTKTRTGLTRYAAPTGMHDDHVMSLAFAYEAARNGVTWEPVTI